MFLQHQLLFLLDVEIPTKKNHIRYKGDINNTSVIIFFNRKVSLPFYVTQQKLPVMVLCLGECPVRFFWYWLLVFHFIFVLHFVVVLHSFPGYFAMPQALHPRFSDPWRPPPALSSTLATFGCLCFFIYYKCYGFKWAFFTNRRLSRPPLDPAVLPWSLQDFMLILQTQTKPICLFDSLQSTIFIFRRIHF